MELLISKIVARHLYRDVTDEVQKAFTVLIRGNILRKTEYNINPQMTSNDQGLSYFLLTRQSRLQMTCTAREAVS